MSDGITESRRGTYWKGEKYSFAKDKAKETDPNRDKNDIKVSDECTFVDWNKFSMDELADYLERKHRFLSDGESFAINRMIDFYRKNKEKV